MVVLAVGDSSASSVAGLMIELRSAISYLCGPTYTGLRPEARRSLIYIVMRVWNSRSCFLFLIPTLKLGAILLTRFRLIFLALTSRVLKPSGVPRRTDQSQWGATDVDPVFTRMHRCAM